MLRPPCKTGSSGGKRIQGIQSKLKHHIQRVGIMRRHGVTPAPSNEQVAK